MSSKNIKIGIGVVVILLVVIIIAFGLRKGSQPKDAGNGKNVGNVVVQSPEDVKQDLIKDDMSDPAVSQDDIENDDNPALDVLAADNDAKTDNEPIIQDPEAEKL